LPAVLRRGERIGAIVTSCWRAAVHGSDRFMARLRKIRILVLMHDDLVPPDSIVGLTDEQIAPWKTEFDIIAGLEALGHEYEPIGVSTDITPLGEAIERFRPHIVFNVLEEFHGVAVYDHYLVSYLELMRSVYTGSNPRGLMLAHDKALSKKVLSYDRIPVPQFAVFPMGHKVKRPAGLQFPLLVKSLTEEGSVGIAQSSVVRNDQKLLERVELIHRQLGADAIAEQYIDGRELYVGILGNERLQTLPIWELVFTKLPANAPRIATEKVKWDAAYQKKVGVKTQAAEDLSAEITDRIVRICKRAYRILGLSGYARMDLRLSADGAVYLIEANPNPQLSYGEDFAESAEHAGISYEQLLQRIVNLGLNYRAQWQIEAAE
jgi:D-alanine-D-alanine ligase